MKEIKVRTQEEIPVYMRFVETIKENHKEEIKA